MAVHSISMTSRQAGEPSTPYLPTLRTSSRQIGPLTGDRKPFPIVQTPFDERDGQLSPDGGWVAYDSNESGRFEVYIQRFPVPTGKVVISTGGGHAPRWRRNGQELF